MLLPGSPIHAQSVQIMTLDNAEAQSLARVANAEQWTYMNFDWSNPDEIRFAHASQPNQQISYLPYDVNGPLTKETAQSTDYISYVEFERGPNEPVQFEVKADSSDHVVRSTHNKEICEGPYLSITEGGFFPELPFWTGLINPSDQNWYYREAMNATEWKDLPAHQGIGIDHTINAGRIEIAVSKDPAAICAVLEWNFEPVTIGFPVETKVVGNRIAIPMIIEKGVGLEGIQGSFTYDHFLTYESFSLQDSVIDGWASSVTVEEGYRKVNFEFSSLNGTGITNEGDLIAWFFFYSAGTYEKQSQLTVDEKSLNFYPLRQGKAQNGSVHFGAETAKGEIKELNGGAISGTNYILQSLGSIKWGSQGPLNSNGTFEILITPAGQFSLKFQHMGSNSSRSINIADITNMMDCNTGAITNCDDISRNTYPDDGPGHVSDTICNVHYWLGIQRNDCVVGVWVYDNPMPLFDNYNTGLWDINVTGRYMGHIYTNANSVVAASASVMTPTITFGTETTLSDGTHVLTLHLQGKGHKALGFELQGAQLIGTPDNWAVNGNRAILMANEGIGDKTIYVKPTAEHIVLDLFHGTTFDRYEADVQNHSPSESYNQFFPLIEGNDPMPELLPDSN